MGRKSVNQYLMTPTLTALCCPAPELLVLLYLTFSLLSVDHTAIRNKHNVTHWKWRRAVFLRQLLLSRPACQWTDGLDSAAGRSLAEIQQRSHGVCVCVCVCLCARAFHHHVHHLCPTKRCWGGSVLLLFFLPSFFFFPVNLCWCVFDLLAMDCQVGGASPQPSHRAGRDQHSPPSSSSCSSSSSSGENLCWGSVSDRPGNRSSPSCPCAFHSPYRPSCAMKLSRPVWPASPRHLQVEACVCFFVFWFGGTAVWSRLGRRRQMDVWILLLFFLFFVLLLLLLPKCWEQSRNKETRFYLEKREDSRLFKEMWTFCVKMILESLHIFFSFYIFKYIYIVLS